MAAEQELSTDLTATYPDKDRARAALVALERAGVEAGRIRMEGADGRRPANDQLRHADMDTAGWLFHRVGLGGIIGVVVGATLGAVAGIVIAAIFDFPWVWSVAIGAGGGGVIVGPLLGGFLGATTALPVDNQDFAGTFEAPAGRPVRVRVHAGGRQERERVERAFQRTGASSIERR